MMDTTQSQTTNRGAADTSRCTRRRSAHLLRGTRTVGHKCLLRTRCRGEVRRRHGMRMRVGRGNTGGMKSVCCG